MGINVGGKRSDGERLFTAIGHELRALGFGERLALFNAIKDDRPFHELAPKFRTMFEGLAERLGLGAARG